MKRAEAEVQALVAENKQLKGKCAKMALAAADNEKVLENLRKTVENNTNEKVALEGRITELELVYSKVDELKKVFTEVAARAEGVYQEYRKALAVLRAEPLPLPEPAEGSQVIFQLLDWMVSEFEGLGEVMSVANGNAASVSFEGLVGNLIRAGCLNLSSLEGDFQYVPYEGLSEELAKIQEAKVAFFEKFWEPSGMGAVRTLAAAAIEVGPFSWRNFSHALISFCVFFLENLIDCAGGYSGAPFRGEFDS